MVKLIASDIDGTLVEEGADKINPELLEVILKLKSKGIYFAAASGRQAVSIEHLFTPIRDKIFYIAENGAYVGCYGRVLFTTPINREDVMSLVREARQEENTEIVLCTPSKSYLATENMEFVRWLRDCYHINVDLVGDLLQVEDEIIKISFNRQENLTGLLEKPLAKYANRLKYSTSGATWIDVMDKSVNKGASLKLLQESLGISPAETMAFGDQLNDLEMLQQVEHSYAVANARPEILETAKYIADTSENNGVLKILKTLL